jgi:ribonucleases P/MRP protein subunit RPP40
LGHIVETEDDCKAMQRDLDKIYQWGVKWQMEFNLDKCVVMHLGHKNRNHRYTLNGTVLKSVDEERDLGVVIDNKLKLKKQCAKAANRANQVLGMIKRNVRSRSQDVILKLYKGLVRPLLEYSIQAWMPYRNGDIKLLERVQKRATKMISCVRDKRYEDRLAELKLTTLEERRIRGDMIMTYKMLYGLERVDINKLGLIYNNSSRRGNSKKLLKKGCRLDIRKHSFSMRIIDKWNSLSEEVVTSTTLNSFKNKYDAHLVKFYKHRVQDHNKY